MKTFEEMWKETIKINLQPNRVTEYTHTHTHTTHTYTHTQSLLGRISRGVP